MSQRLRSFLQLYVCAQERMHDMQTEVISLLCPSMATIVLMLILLLGNMSMVDAADDGNFSDWFSFGYSSRT